MLVQSFYGVFASDYGQNVGLRGSGEVVPFLTMAKLVLTPPGVSDAQLNSRSATTAAYPNARPSMRGEEPHPPRGNPGCAEHGGSRADHSKNWPQVGKENPDRKPWPSKYGGLAAG